jgi:NAD(P)-dependent dehydrogenase (short-subunit alcohol dehydrogenase family)
MALELGPKQIRVNAVAPGYINTPTNAGVVAGPEAVKEQEGKIALGRMGTAEEVADVVAFLFRYVFPLSFLLLAIVVLMRLRGSEEARYMTGSVVEITGGRA